MGCSIFRDEDRKQKQSTFKPSGKITLNYLSLLDEKVDFYRKKVIPIEIALSLCKKYLYVGYTKDRIFKYDLGDSREAIASSKHRKNLSKLI